MVRDFPTYELELFKKKMKVLKNREVSRWFSPLLSLSLPLVRSSSKSRADRPSPPFI